MTQSIRHSNPVLTESVPHLSFSSVLFVLPSLILPRQLDRCYAPLECKLKTYWSFPLRHRRFYCFRLFHFILLYSSSHDVFPFFKGISRGPLSPFVPAFVQFCCGDRALLARMPSRIAGKSLEPEGFRETSREKRDKGLCNRTVASNTEPFEI